MTAVTPDNDAIFTVDGVPLKTQLRRAERMRKLKAIGLIMPLFLFLMVTFIYPIGTLLVQVYQNPEMNEVLPRTAAAMRAWNGEGLPGDATLAIFATEAGKAMKAKVLAKAAKRLNYDISGFRSLMMKTGRKLKKKAPPESGVIDFLTKIDKHWGQTKYWSAIKRASSTISPFYILAALDLKQNSAGEIVSAPKNVSIYLNVLGRTFWISFVVTVFCLALGYPVAYLLATLPTKQSNLLMILVLLPFWTSLLVRTTAWVVLLQTKGLINDLAIRLGLWTEPIQLIYNRTGVYVAMVHILLPFMVLPIFSVMKGISPTHMRAALSLGANPLRSFIKVYVPQTIPGVGAGVLLVFIISLGYYITPALVGGARDQMQSQFIVYFTNETLNWGMAAALSIVLLVLVIIFYWLYDRVVGIDKMKLG